MTKEEAIVLQEMMTQEAAAMLRATDRQGNTAPYETAIPLIGKVWSIPEKQTAKCIETIGKEAAGIEVFEEECLPTDGFPLETLKYILALIETAMQTHQLYECKALLELALQLADSKMMVELFEGLTKIDKEAAVYGGFYSPLSDPT